MNTNLRTGRAANSSPIAPGLARCRAAQPRTGVSPREVGSVQQLALLLAYADGKPAENAQLTGRGLHAHASRPLASLSDEQVHQLAVRTTPREPEEQLEAKPTIDQAPLE